MTGVEILHSERVPSVPDLVHRVRGLSFFVRHLTEGLKVIARREGLSITIDRRRVVEVFVAWAAVIDAQKAASRIDRRDYIVFSAGMLLEKLLKSRAITAQVMASDGARRASPAARHWPEGYLATAYCMEVLEEVLAQSGYEPLAAVRLSDDMPTWCSFRENSLEDISTVVPFFDLMIGGRPNWTMPTLATERQAIKTAARRLAAASSTN